MPKVDLEDLAKLALAILFVAGMGVLAAFALGFYMVRVLMEILFEH